MKTEIIVSKVMQGNGFDSFSENYALQWKSVIL